MTQSPAVSGPARSVSQDLTIEAEPVEVDYVNGPGKARPSAVPRLCSECGKSGIRSNAKTHPGACAQQRRTRLQKLRRDKARGRTARDG